MFLTEVPGSLAAAAGMMGALGAGQMAANAVAAPMHTAVAPSALDEVSALVAAQFSAHGVMYQSTQAAGMAEHMMAVANLGISEASYDLTEAAGVLNLG